jgi:hypothetical protein
MTDHDTDAERRAAIIAMFTPRDLNEEPPEPPIEGLAPRDKNVADYSDAERAAQHESVMRTMREREQRQERERQQLEADATRTPDQQHGDTIGQLLAGRIATAAAAVTAMHPEVDE